MRWGHIAMTLLGCTVLFTLGCEDLLGVKDLTVEETHAPTTDTSLTTLDAGAPTAVDTPAADRDAGKSKISARPPIKRVFVTEGLSSGVIGGREPADQRCVAAALSQGLGTSWIAWMSQSGAETPNAIDRITHDGPYQRLDNVLIVTNKEQLASGNLLAPISVTETKREITHPSDRDPSLVWTGTFGDGTRSTTCANWATSRFDQFGAIGSLDRPEDGKWTDNGGPGFPFRDWQCFTSARLYCFEL